MLSDGANHVSVEKSFRIKQDDRFFSRLMAKETSVANSSSRVLYYGEKSVAVPFMWEAQPGTPKHPLSEISLQPPLTPPPSYYSNSKSNTKLRNSKANIFSSILPRFACSGKTHASASSSRLSSSYSSSSSSSTWSMVYSSSSFSMRDKDRGSLSAVVSCFKHKASNGFRGCYPFGNVKNAIVSHGAV